MQLLEDCISLGSVHHKPNVDLGGALAHHLDLAVVLLKELEHGGHHRGALGQVGHDAHDTFVLLHLDVGNLLQVLQQRGQVGDRLQLLVQGEGHRDLRGGDHVHAQLVLLEQPKHLGEEAVLAEHAGGGDVDEGDIVLHRQGRGQVLHLAGAGDDGARVLRVVGVLHAHGDVEAHGRPHRDGVQHLGAEVGQLGGLLEGDLGHGPRRGHHPRVRRHDAVHVLPHLHLVGPNGGRQEGGREVRAPAAQRGDRPILGGAHEAGDHGHQVLVHRAQGRLHVRVRLLENFSVLEVVGGPQPQSKGVESLRRHPNAVELGGHEPHAEPLAEGHQQVQRARAQLLQAAHAHQHLLQLLQQRIDLLLGTVCGTDFICCEQVQSLDSIHIHLSLHGEVTSGEEVVGGLAHRRANHDWAVALFDEVFNEQSDLTKTIRCGQ
mmetsp:Transcript_56794/g.83119  ORF Transcript_56794/g.83119 Transcript_56794/m.83119 type:complete len:432 (-) Transcript_56794:291-1586(-)